jgi:cytochrome bd-type quinol oxidase subunit 1
MNIFLIMLAMYFIWFALGMWYLSRNLGNKYGKEPWYAGLLLLPVLPIAVAFGWVTALTRK